MPENERREKAGDAIKAQGQQDGLTPPAAIRVVGAEDGVSPQQASPGGKTQAGSATRKAG